MKNQVLQRPTQEDIGSTKKNQPVQFNPPPHSLSTCRVLCGFRVWKFLRADFLRFYLFKFSSYPPSTLLCTSPSILLWCPPGPFEITHSHPLFTILHSCRGFSSDLVMAKEHTDYYFPFHRILDNAHICISYARAPVQWWSCSSYSDPDIFTSIAFHRGTHLVLLLLVYVKPEERQISHYDCIDRSIANKPSNPPSHAFN